MGNAWNTDLRRFLNEDGTRAGMSNRARRFIDYFGGIVKKVTTRRGNALATGIRCRKRFRHKPRPKRDYRFYR